MYTGKPRVPCPISNDCSSTPSVRPFGSETDTVSSGIPLDNYHTAKELDEEIC